LTGSALGIRPPFEIAESVADIFGALDEALGQPAIEKGEDVVGVDGALGQVGAGDQHGVAGQPPALDDAVEEILHVGILAEDAQHEQGGRPAGGALAPGHEVPAERYPEQGQEIEQGTPAFAGDGAQGRASQGDDPDRSEQVEQFRDPAGGIGFAQPAADGAGRPPGDQPGTSANSAMAVTAPICPASQKAMGLSASTSAASRSTPACEAQHRAMNSGASQGRRPASRCPGTAR
jgi:hypothetical protein